MKEYKVKIKETLEKYVFVLAENADDAADKVEKKWKDQDFILDAEDFKGVEFHTVGMVGKTPYNVRVEERLSRGVVIFAHDADEAHDIAENLCNNGNIDLDSTDFIGREIEVVGIAEDCQNSVNQTFVEEE